MKYDPQYTTEHYDTLALGETERWDKSRFMKMQREVIRWHLSNRVVRGHRLLDAGCGSGVFTRHLLDLGASVTALDISPVQLQLCREAAPGATDYLQGTIVDLSRFETGQFDVVLALGGPVSYCFECAPQAVAELVRVLRPGGIFGCSVMSLYGACHQFLPGVLAEPEFSRDVLQTGDLSRADNRRHECHLFGPEELRSLLSDAGLADIELSAPAWLSAVWPDASLPDEGTDEWTLLFDAELQAGRECPSAGTHILGWATR